MDGYVAIKRGNTGLAFKATLGDTSTPWDLNTSQVLFYFGPFTIQPEITNAENREVIVAFEEEHTAEVKKYYGEFKVTHPDNRVESYPGANEYIVIDVTRDGGGA